MNEKPKKIIENDQELFEFLLYSYFGIDNVIIEDVAEVATKCAKRAYLDLARTLTFEETLKGKENKTKQYVRRKFRDDMCKVIVQSIEEKIFCNELLEIDDEQEKKKKFDEIHDEICKKNIVEKAQDMMFHINESPFQHILENEEGESFYYGQAQKWLNMTLKYMRLVGLWKTQMKSLETCLHVPVDSFIMEAAAGRERKGKNKDKSTQGEGIELKCKDGEKREKYREGNSDQDPLPWSQWDDKTYKDFQKDIREKVDSQMYPIMWESKKWIEVAKNRTEIEDSVTYDEKYVKVDWIK